jgi:hypothetical protein
MVLELKFLQPMLYKTKNYINKIICREESSEDLPFHWFFINDSITNTSSVTKVGIMVSNSQCIAHLPQRPNVELQIKIGCPFHLDVFMHAFKQQLEGPKRL